MSKGQAWILIVIAIVGVGAFIQMNRYKYLPPETLVGSLGVRYVIRIDHLTNEKCFIVSAQILAQGIQDALKLPSC